MVSIMTLVNPYISNSSPFHAGYLSVIEASSKVMLGGHQKILDLNKYFESLQNDTNEMQVLLVGAF